MNELTGEYGCPRRFKYQRDAEWAVLHPAARGTAAVGDGDDRPEKMSVSSSLACGTAAHETIARALNAPAVRAFLLKQPHEVDLTEQLGTLDKLTGRVRAVFEQELRIAADDRPLEWGKDDPEATIAARVAMCVGVLGSLCKYARDVVAVEPGFIVLIEDVWYSGHIDLIFEPCDVPAPAVGLPPIGICDWKTGKTKPDTIELTHGWEGGIYAAACARGVFLPRESVTVARTDDGAWRGGVTFDCKTVEVVRPTRWQAERDALEHALMYIAGGASHPDMFRLDCYPDRVYHVHLGDFVPYEKTVYKEAKRPEDVAFYGLTGPGRVKCVAGDVRGPAWIPVDLQPTAISRLAYRAKTVVGTVRMGRFFDLVREHCRRCPFARDCLTTGYAVRGDELTALQTELKKAGLT